MPVPPGNSGEPILPDVRIDESGRDIDLGRWLGGKYAIPAEEEADREEPGSEEPGKTE